MTARPVAGPDWGRTLSVSVKADEMDRIIAPGSRVYISGEPPGSKPWYWWFLRNDGKIALSREPTPPDVDDSAAATVMRPGAVLAREPGGLVGDVAVYDRTTGELLRDPPPEGLKVDIEYVERPRAPLDPPPVGNPPPVSRRALAYLADRPGPTRSAAEVAEAIIVPGESLRKVKKAVSTALRSAADAGKVRRIEADGGVRYRYNRPATTEAEG